MPRVLALLSVVLFLFQGFGAARYDAPTYDEPTHLTSGYVFLKTGLYWVDVTAPPLVRVLSAAPLLFLPIEFPTQDPSWTGRDRFAFATRFLFFNRYSADAILLLSRSMILGLGILLACVLWLWVKVAAGEWAAAFTLLFFATCPPLLALAHIVTTDFGFTVFFTAALAAFWAHRQNPENRTFVAWAGMAFGMALYAKYTAVFFIPIVVAIVLFERFGSAAKLTRRIQSSMIVVMIGILLFTPFLLLKWPVCVAAWETLRHFSQVGWPSFFAGHISSQGRPWYFAALLAVKTPLALLVAMAAAFALQKKNDREASLLRWLLVPCVLFLAVMSFGRIQVGVRHILPLYPLFCVMGGIGVAFLWQSTGLQRGVAALLLVGSLVSSARAYPHYIAYIGVQGGGSSRGLHLLSDSNFDWGQEIKALASYLRDEQVGTIYLSYFGSVDPAYYGIRYQAIYPVNSNPLMPDALVDVPHEKKVLFAVSATNLQGLYLRRPEALSWLLARSPVRVLGHTLYVYDITRDADAHRQIAALYDSVGQKGLAQRERSFADAIR